MSSEDFHYTVKGRWPFPLDMLRRDRSVAASPEDQEHIDFLSSPCAPDRDAIRTRRVINLVILGAGRWRPNTARWRSFGWDVPDDETFRMLEEAEARVERMKALRRSALLKLTPEERDAIDWFSPSSRA